VNQVLFVTFNISTTDVVPYEFRVPSDVPPPNATISSIDEAASNQRA
jgi:hypothetical protein